VPLEQALVATGFGYQAGRRKVQGEVVAALLPRVRDIRRAGTSAVDLCSVAAGRVDAYYERGLNQWDYAAGALIAAEAGAVVGGLGGAPASTSMTIAAGPDLFAALAEVLAALDAERDALGVRIAEPGIVFQRGIDGRYTGFTSGRNRYGVGHVRAGAPATCAPRRNVAEFPAGIGHNLAFRSVTPAQRPCTTDGGGWVITMATDYDSPRKTDDDLTEDSLQELQARRMDKSSSTIDLDPDDVAESLELPGADLSNEELSFRVIPRQADEFTCSRCFLVHHRSQLAEDRNGQLVCRECAA